MMKRIILLLFMSFFIGNIFPNNSLDYFHKTSNFFINGDKPNAKKTIAEALRQFPNDPKLKQLANAVNKLPDDKNDKKGQFYSLLSTNRIVFLYQTYSLRKERKKRKLTNIKDIKNN